MADQAERLRPASRAGGRKSFAAGVIALLAIAAWAWRGHAPSSSAAGVEHSLVVARQPFSLTLSLVGTLQSRGGTAVFAPFDGAVETIDFAYGDHVRPGQRLVALDTTEVEDQRNGAESELLKAQQAMADVVGWSSGSEMSHARRAKTAAAMELAGIDRDLAQTKALLDKGLVPRSEYDALVDRRRAQLLANANTDEEYASTLRRGQGDNLRIASIDLSRARIRFVTLTNELRSAIVLAPGDGVVVRPPREAGENNEDLHVGSHLIKGQLIGSIARADALSAEFKLDEVDVDKVHVGQHVTVTGPAFGDTVLTGAIASVGGDPVKGTGQSDAKATYAAVARLDPAPPAATAALRLGMTATVTVETYSAPAAIVVPAAAVSGASPSATVTIRKDGHSAPRVVTIGQVSPDGVEIRTGLRPGEMIVWTDPVVPAT